MSTTTQLLVLVFTMAGCKGASHVEDEAHVESPSMYPFLVRDIWKVYNIPAYGLIELIEYLY